jgi:hypothetical protein
MRRAGYTFCSFCAVAACLLPLPPDQAVLPNVRPTIVRTSVLPVPERVITQLQGNLVVPVELIDPSQRFEWRLYVDYDPSGISTMPNDPEDPGGRIGKGESPPDGTDRTIRVLEIPLSRLVSDLSPQRCHVIEILVAQAFLGESRREGHTPKPPGGDTVSWFYSPNGTLDGCPVQAVTLFDAGPNDAAGRGQ